MHDLNGKVAIVTGASKGIGAGIAKMLAQSGAKVVVNYASSKMDADNVVKDIEANGGEAVAVQADVAEISDVKYLFDKTIEAYDRLDVLVNNAGVVGYKPLAEIDEDYFHWQFRTNVLGLLLVTREASKYFDVAGGSIINIGSVVTSMLLPGSVVYAATKGAVDAITGVLAKELGSRNIRVNSINPGYVEIERNRGYLSGDLGDRASAQTPLGRLGRPDDIAAVATFLASDAAGWLTGQHILASGGLR